MEEKEDGLTILGWLSLLLAGCRLKLVGGVDG